MIYLNFISNLPFSIEVSIDAFSLQLDYSFVNTKKIDLYNGVVVLIGQKWQQCLEI